MFTVGVRPGQVSALPFANGTLEILEFSNRKNKTVGCSALKDSKICSEKLNVDTKFQC